MMRPDDIEHCRNVIRTGSYSFHAASKLLPADVRDPALALYAFCRLADDEVDEGDHKRRAVLDLQQRLDGIYAGQPRNAPEDRAFAAIVDEFEMPKALPDALLEGLAWDAQERRYADLSGVRSYSARVASAVGVMMCVLMRARDADALARACDLGVAMQLTNIARDVGEDARAGRIYLPLDWLDEAGLDVEEFLQNPHVNRATKRMTSRLLAEAQKARLDTAQLGVPCRLDCHLCLDVLRRRPCGWPRRQWLCNGVLGVADCAERPLDADLFRAASIETGGAHHRVDVG